MNNGLPPIAIELLLWCYSRVGPPPNAESPACCEWIATFLDEGLIERDEQHDGYATTPYGKAYVKALCSLPPPRLQYVDQLGNVIEENTP